MILRFKNSFIFTIVLLLSMHAAAQHFKLSSTIENLSSPLTCLTLSTDGNFLISGDATGSVDFRDPESGKMVKSEKAFHSAINSISFNSTGRLMLVTTREGEIKVYDFQQEKFIQSLYSPDYTDLRFALFSIADGFIYFNGQGRLYKTRSDLSQPVEQIYEFDSVITNAVITDDRSALLFTCGNAVKVLNTRTDNIIQEISTSAAGIERMALSSDHKLVTWSNDGTIVFRNFELNQLSTDLLLWFKAGASSKLLLSHDGSMMVTGGIGTWARIWKPFQRNVLQELFGHQDAVTDFTFSADDQVLYTTSLDKTIKIWMQKDMPKKTPPVITEAPPKIQVSEPVKTVDTIKPVVIQQETGDLSMPAIDVDSSGIPVYVGGRKVDKTSVVEVSDSTVDIYVFDNSSPDGDIMSLSFHNQWILAHYEVTKQKKKITLHLNPGGNNFLVLFADNLGYTPPNTAAISFDPNGREKIFMLQSDLKSCSAINFIFKK